MPLNNNKDTLKKILIVNNSTAGLWGFRQELIEKLCARYKVIILAKDTGSVEQMLNLNCQYIPINWDYHGTNVLQEARLMSLLFRHIREIRPNMVLTYTIKPNIYVGIVCATLKIPYISNITGLGTAVEKNGALQRITIPLYRFGLRKASMVFFQNTENRDFMLEHHMINGPYELLPGSGVNLEKYRYLEYPKDDNIIRFTFISRIMKEKGIDHFLDAARYFRSEYPNIHFDIYGKCDGDYESTMSSYQNEGIITYHGYTSDIIKVHSVSSCTIHPSYYPEGMSNVLLESAACGRPIITTNRSGCRETVTDQVTGFIVKTRDSEDLIAKMKSFIALTWEERRAMGQKGREKVEKEFDRNVVVGKYLKEIERGL